ncbi:hypothetical protein FXO37_02856 [Capsicum annuum]|nr:hypothetical protein FXO37_02856 [Capsicum annuum]
MTMVYVLLKCRIKYVDNDQDLKEGGKKMDELWINYCGILICFGMNAFAIVTSLRCHHPLKLLPKHSYIFRLRHLNPFATSCNSSRITRMRFLIQGSLGDLGAASGDNSDDFGGGDGDASRVGGATSRHDDKYIADAQEKSMFLTRVDFLKDDDDGLNPFNGPSSSSFGPLERRDVIVPCHWKLTIGKLHGSTMQSYCVTTLSTTWKLGMMHQYHGATLEFDNRHLSYLRDARKAQIMPPRKFDARSNSSIPSEDNMDRALPTLKVQTRLRVIVSDCPEGDLSVPPISPQAP